MFRCVQQFEHSDQSLGVKLSRFQLNGAFLKLGFRDEINMTCSGEVSFVFLVGAFAKINFFNGFGNDKVHVGIPLTMGMRNHVYGKPVYRYSYICTVVDVETAQKDLLCFSSSSMLTDEEAGNLF